MSAAGLTVWVTGLSGAGKTTLCQAMARLLKPVVPELVVLDGDLIREAFGNDLGFDVASRVRQISRIQRFARALSEQGLVVLVAALYASPELLAWNRAHLRGYVEVYLRASPALLRARDQKGLYSAAEPRSVVGRDIPWLEPSAPDLAIDADTAPSPDALARHVIERVPALARRLA